MDFKEYYKNKDIVNSYDDFRSKGVKARVIRKLELKFVDSLVQKDKNQKVLEIGVGTGFISKLLKGKGKFWGMDISEEMLKRAKKVLGNVKLVKGNILNIKLKDKFDRIVTIRVISHFDKEDAVIALKNIRKILNNNGKVIFNLENKSIFRRFMRRILRWGSTYTYQYSGDEVNEICEKAGLKVDNILYLDHLFILPLHIINKLLFNKLENFIYNIELGLSNVKFMSNNFFIRCKK